LVRKSLRWGKKSEAVKGDVVDRLHGLVTKTGVPRITKEGELVIDEDLADKNAISASALLIAIEGQQQKDDHLEKRLAVQSKPVQQQQPQTTINVGVNVDNRMDERRRQTLSIIERVGAGRGIQLDGSGSPAIVVREDEGAE
jgi:hypothetical protein